MAARIDGMFDDNLKKAINNSELLVVGAGGIGCELLKTLVLTGFEKIHIIDLDTIDLSNLNRQFLFHKQHIGKPKAVVAKESALIFNPKAQIEASHASITNTEYNVQFYRQFTAVLNALDNVAARSHVNRMCMAADVPLIESGSAGYLGQATVYKRRETECFECLPRKPQKTYPGCTIRNTPSEPVHCVVWAKHLFNQLFGENDAEDNVSPDATDPDINQSENSSSIEVRISTREMAKASNYDPDKLFKKLFHEDILYLKTMVDLWKKRRSPIPLVYENLPDAVPGCSQSKETAIADFMPWSLKHSGEVFKQCVEELRKRIEEGGPSTVLTWDKDDKICLDFVVASTNLRSHIFHIPQKSKFDIKAIAGNIIPAIATTNAIVGGLIVLQVLKLLGGDTKKCRTTWLNETYRTTCKLISSGQLEKPSPKCLVCSPSEPEVQVRLNVETLTIRTLDDKILKEKLLMVQPDVVINDGSGKILISSEDDDMSDEMYEKSLSCFQIQSDSRLLCEDFFQNFKIHLVVQHDKDISGQEFQFESDIEGLKPTEEELNSSSSPNPDTSNDKNSNDVMDCDDPDLEIIPISFESADKDGNDDENGMEPPTKKIKSGQ